MIHLLGEFNCNGSLLAIDPCYEDDNDGVLIHTSKSRSLPCSYCSTGDLQLLEKTKLKELPLLIEEVKTPAGKAELERRLKGE